MNHKSFIPPEETISSIKKMKTGFLIVGGPEKQVWGTLPDKKTLFVWTTKDKAEEFIKDNGIDSSEEKVIEEPMTSIYAMAIKLGFTTLRFDFIAKGRHPEQGFIHCNVNQAIANQSLENLLEVFHSS